MKNSINYIITIIILIIFVVGGYRYYQYMIKKNFTLQVNTICDPKTEKGCFDSTEDLSFGQTPYKKVMITASYAPKCLEEHNCESFSCSNISNDTNICEITYCSNDTKDPGENCLGQ